MNKIFFVTVFIFFSCSVHSQTTRYFEFRQPFDTAFTSFIAASSDTGVINSVLADLTLPIANRRFISGNITSGNGGFNHNGTSWYSWHYSLNEWQLTTTNFEYCDGISSLIGNHPSIISGDTIYFCPWSSYPYQEVFNPNVSVQELSADLQLELFPNPASEEVIFEWAGSSILSIEIFDVTGQLKLKTSVEKPQNSLNIDFLTDGLYFFNISDGFNVGVKKVFVKH